MRSVITIVTFIIFITLVFLMNNILKAEEILAEDIDRGYKIVQAGKHGEKLIILLNEKVIYEIVPKYSEEVHEYYEGESKGNNSVYLIYGSLIRGGENLKEQPKAFDDVTGDGSPDIICLENNTFRIYRILFLC